MDLTQLSIEERVGRGGMGSVHRAVWKSPMGGVDVALKFLAGNVQMGAETAFLREARAAARLSHPNIVTLLDAGRVATRHGSIEPGTPYLVMEWVDGESLADRRPANWTETLAVLRHLLHALAHAHGWGVLHRDLKPANVLWPLGGVARLTDFGVGRVLDDALEAPLAGGHRQIAGTPNYMAPEQVLGEPRDEGPWTDVYGLAAMAWELVCGKPLFTGDTTDVLVAQVRARPPRLEAAFRVPYGLRNWLYTALEKRPGDRFSSAAEALWALDDMENAERTSRYPVVTPASTTASVSTRVSVPQRHSTEDRPVESALRAAGAALFGMRQPPIVGRAVEKELLWNAFRRVYRLKRSEVAVVRGAPGQGKSGLANWLARRATEGGHAAVIRSQHDADVAGESALTGAVVRWFRLDGLGEAEALERLMRGLADLGFEDAQLLALDFVARRWPTASQRRGLQPTEDWHRFLLEFARRAGRGGPTIWVVEDMHLSQLTMDFVKLAAEVDFPLLVVGTTQSAGPVEIRRSFDIELGPLGDSAMSELVHAMLPLDPSLTDALVDRAGGSPMFATVLLADWVARKILEPGPLGYRALPEAVRDLPESVQAVWRDRIDAALDGQPPVAMDALRVAAVMGRSVTLDDWRVASRTLGVNDPDALLEALAPFGLVSADTREVRISHELLRESIIHDSPDLKRHHLAAAQAIGAHHPSPRGAERVARHLWEAGAHLPALDRLYDAIVRYDAAGEEDPVLFLVPLLQEWAETTGESSNLCLADALWRLSCTQRLRGGIRSGIEATDEARRILLENTSLESLLVRPDSLANRIAANTAVGMGVMALHIDVDTEAALRHFRQAAELARVAGHADVLLQAVTFQSDILQHLGRLEEASEVITAAVVGDLESGADLTVALQANLQMAELHVLRGDLPAGLVAAQRAYEAAAALGLRDHIGFTLSNLADLHAYDGQLGKAREFALRAADVYAESGAWVERICHFSALSFEVMGGRVADAVDSAKAFATDFAGENFLPYRGTAHMMSAACAAAAGDAESAAAQFRTAIETVSGGILCEMVILALVLAENASAPLRGQAVAFVEDHRSRLPAFYLPRLEAIA